MEEVRNSGPKYISLSKAILILVLTISVVIIAGMATGYLVFWNSYEPVSKEDYAVAEAMSYVDKYPKDYRSYMSVGSTYLRKGDPQSALEWFQKADKLKKNDAVVNYNMGLAYFSMTQYDKAIELMKPLADKNKMNFDIHYYMAAVYYAKGDFDKAIESFKWAIKLQPGAADANLFLAKAYYKKGEKELSKQHLDKALKMVPNYDEALEFKAAFEANKPID